MDTDCQSVDIRRAGLKDDERHLQRLRSVPVRPETAARRASERFDAATRAVVAALEQLATAQAEFEAAGADYAAKLDELADPWARLDAANTASGQAKAARTQFLDERNRAVADIWEGTQMSLEQI